MKKDLGNPITSDEIQKALDEITKGYDATNILVWGIGNVYIKKDADPKFIAETLTKLLDNEYEEIPMGSIKIDEFNQVWRMSELIRRKNEKYC